MSLPPAVIVHGLDEVCTVLVLARPVTLLSAPGAAAYAGCGWWRALMTHGRNAFPDVAFSDLLDCGEASGHALAALRIGLVRLVLAPAAPGWDAVAAIVAAQGGVILPHPPIALDLAVPAARRQLHDWLHPRTTLGDSGPGVG